jgi:hypothetical protein
MVRAAYFDPDRDETVNAGQIDERSAADLISKVLTLRSSAAPGTVPAQRSCVVAEAVH